MNRRDLMKRAAHAGLAPAVLMGGEAGSGAAGGAREILRLREVSRFRGLIAALEYARLDNEAVERRHAELFHRGQLTGELEMAEGRPAFRAVQEAEWALLCAIREGRREGARSCGVLVDGRTYLAHEPGVGTYPGGLDLATVDARDVRDLDTPARAG